MIVLGSLMYGQASWLPLPSFRLRDPREPCLPSLPAPEVRVPLGYACSGRVLERYLPSPRPPEGKRLPHSQHWGLGGRQAGVVL